MKERIQNAIEELHGKMTILIISHRLSTIRGADMIYVIEEGRLIESGTWDSLVARKGAVSVPYARRKGLKLRIRFDRRWAIGQKNKKFKVQGQG